MEADKSLLLLDSQIKKVGEELTSSEAKLNEFQLLYGTVNVDLEIAGLIEEISLINEKNKHNQNKRVESESIYNKNSQQILSLDKQESELSKQLEMLNSRVKDLPKTQQEYINLFGQVQINKKFLRTIDVKKVRNIDFKSFNIG